MYAVLIKSGRTNVSAYFAVFRAVNTVENRLVSSFLVHGNNNNNNSYDVNGSDNRWKAVWRTCRIGQSSVIEDGRRRTIAIVLSSKYPLK